MGLTLPSDANPETAEIPAVSPNWMTTRLDSLVNWGRANSLWSMPFGTACCAIEFFKNRLINIVIPTKVYEALFGEE